jgi:simple sugar transport system ATP-binding protein
MKLLEVCQLSKRFGATVANDQLTFDVRAGELHCLFGENGAGKSTLSACLTGFHRPDFGAIVFDGREVEFATPADALDAGIGICRQHFSLVERFTVLENLLLGTERGALRFDRNKARARFNELCRRLGLSIGADTPIAQLAIGERQWVEILKALYRDVRLLILDEPTAVLTPAESRRLFTVIERLRGDGLTVLLISHKLSEVMAADRITVLRRGRAVATVRPDEVTSAQLTALMMGAEPPPAPARTARRKGEVMLEVEGLAVPGPRHDFRLEGPPLRVQAGEVLGIAGVAGNGQREFLDALVGLARPGAGRVMIAGTDMTHASPAERMRAGVGSIPEDRYGEALVSDFSIAENMALGWHRTGRLGRGPLLSRRRMAAFARSAIEGFAIRQAGPDTLARVLSGGNAQRVVVAREIERGHCLLIANQPARGLDVGAVAFLYERLIEAAERGAAVVLASEEAEDLIGLCDRIAVFFKGRVVGVVEASSTSLAEVGAMMAGKPA